MTIETQDLPVVEFPQDALVRLADAFAGDPVASALARSLASDIHLQPGFRFDPRMPGRTYRDQPNEVVLHQFCPSPLPTEDIDIAFASIVEQSAWIRTGAITSGRLVEIYLERIARIDPHLKAFITVTADLARKEAAERDVEQGAGQLRGPLHGIPYTLKDVFDTAGIPTTWGCALYQDQIPASDATVVTMLRSAGAVLLGKVASAELANGASWFGGEVRNPWNLEEPSGGSSSGSGSAVAAALCAFSVGTDNAGSILNPSDRCGLVGLRPTFGRVPVTGCMPLAPTLERIGPMCRRVEDCALVLSAINGPDSSSANSLDVAFHYDGNNRLDGTTVGYSATWFQHIGFDYPGIPLNPVPPAQSLEFTLDALRAVGAVPVEVELDPLPYRSLINILYVESAAIFEELTLSGNASRLISTWAENWRRARLLSAVDFYQLERLRRQVMQMMDRIFEKVEMVIAPTYGCFDLLLLTNFTGHPGLTFRSGTTLSPTRDLAFLTSRDGPAHRVTTNLSLHGRLFEEGEMLKLARALEERFGAWSERPPVD